MADTILSGNFAAAGASAAADISDHGKVDPNNDKYTIILSGDDGGGTTVLQVAQDDPPTLWVTETVQVGNMTFPVAYIFQLRANHIRLLLSGGAAHDLDYKIFH